MVIKGQYLPDGQYFYWWDTPLRNIEALLAADPT